MKRLISLTTTSHLDSRFFYDATERRKALSNQEIDGIKAEIKHAKIATGISFHLCPIPLHV